MDVKCSNAAAFDSPWPVSCRIEWCWGPYVTELCWAALHWVEHGERVALAVVGGRGMRGNVRGGSVRLGGSEVERRRRLGSSPVMHMDKGPPFRTWGSTPVLGLAMPRCAWH